MPRGFVLGVLTSYYPSYANPRIRADNNCQLVKSIGALGALCWRYRALNAKHGW